MAASIDWNSAFADPIPLPDGRELLTLRDAGHYVASLPKREQQRDHWQTATALLLLVGEHGGDPMLPRIAMMQALNHGRPDPQVAPGRKRAKTYTVMR